MFREGRSSLPQVFVDRRVECKKSPIHRWGCFATEDIEPHVIIESAPVILCHGSAMDALYEINSCRHILQDYPFTWKDGMVAFAMGWAAIYNHDQDASVVWQPNFDYETLEFFTKRKISAGEELTVRYLPLRLRGSLWFHDENAGDINVQENAADQSRIKNGNRDWKFL